VLKVSYPARIGDRYQDILSVVHYHVSYYWGYFIDILAYFLFPAFSIIKNVSWGVWVSTSFTLFMRTLYFYLVKHPIQREDLPWMNQYEQCFQQSPMRSNSKLSYEWFFDSSPILPSSARFTKYDAWKKISLTPSLFLYLKIVVLIHQ